MQTSGHEAIGHPLPSQQGVGSSQPITPQQSARAQPDAEAPSSRTDSVHLSAHARDLQRIAHILRQTPEVREHRVQAASRAVAEGTLNVHGPDLADRLLADALHVDRRIHD